MNDDKHSRLMKLQNRMNERAIDCALLVNSRDIFYYTGTAQPVLLLVTPTEYFLLARRETALIAGEVWINPDRIMSGGGYAEAYAMLHSLGITNGKIGLELDILSAEAYLRIRHLFAAFEPYNISPDVLTQRMIKDGDEIKLIRKACQVMKAGHQRMFEVLTPGMTELELAAEIEMALRKAGHEGDYAIRMADFFMSRGPLASGENLLRISGFGNTITGVGLSAALPTGPSLRKVNQGDLIVVDIPICCQGYHCDESRTYVVGEPTEEVRSLFESLQKVEDSVLASLRAGTSSGEVFQVACKRAEELGIGEYFLKLNNRRGNFIGHGIGLEVNEPPLLSVGSSTSLQANMVITVEIHLSHPQHGAMKIEQMVLITETGYEMLSLAGNELYLINNE